MKHLFPIFIFLVALVFASCDQDTECRTVTKVVCQVTFSLDSVMQSGETKYFDAVDSITVKGVGRDSLLYGNAKGLKSISLPLRTDTTVTAYALTINGVQDTLQIFHQNNPSFISLACGCVVYHTIDSASSSQHLISGVLVTESDVASKAKNNLCIYVHYPKK